MDKVALITGCNGGIGRSLCERFRSGGFLIFGVDRAGSPPASCDAFHDCNIAELVSSESTRKQLLTAFNAFLDSRSAQLHVLINNAAVQVTGGLENISPDQFMDSLQVNVAAPFVLAQLFRTELLESEGCIVNIGSIHSRLTKPGFSAYATSKAALGGLTRALAIEFAGKVTVNTLSPAAIGTSMLLAGFNEHPEKLKELASHHPAQRIGTPDEVADFAYWLCTGNSRFITGADLAIDGGIGGRLHDPE